MAHIGICYQRGHSMDAHRMATTLRRAGVVCDLALSGKPQKQFDRLKRSGAGIIVEVQTAEHCVMWWAFDGVRRHGTVQQAIDYFLWLEDDTDVLPEPDGPFVRACV